MHDTGPTGHDQDCLRRPTSPTATASAPPVITTGPRNTHRVAEYPLHYVTPTVSWNTPPYHGTPTVPRNIHPNAIGPSCRGSSPQDHSPPSRAKIAPTSCPMASPTSAATTPASRTGRPLRDPRVSVVPHAVCPHVLPWHRGRRRLIGVSCACISCLCA